MVLEVPPSCYQYKTQKKRLEGKIIQLAMLYLSQEEIKQAPCSYLMFKNSLDPVMNMTG